MDIGINLDVYENENIPYVRIKQNKIALRFFMVALTLALFASVPIAMSVTGVSDEQFWQNLAELLTGPARLSTDYFMLGCLASTLFNAAVCGLACTLILLWAHAHATAATFAAYMLIIAHCFYGLNFVNMWPTIIGVLLYCLITKRSFKQNLHVAMFSTALAPFFTDFLFYYPPGRTLTIYGVSVLGIVLSIGFGIASGFLVPAILPGVDKMHRGFSMYRAGLSIGLLGIFMYCFLYKTLGVEPHTVTISGGSNQAAFGLTQYVFMNVFFTVIFLLAIIIGYVLNGRSFRNYKKLISCSGYGMDFVDKFGMPLCLINFGIYGFCILAYVNVIFCLPHILPFLPEGVGFTGPTAGVVLAALTFSADGQHPRNVAPIAVGYSLLFASVCSICLIAGAPIPWTLSTQAYISGLAFATGLCPIAGVYGFRYGVIAGLVSAIVCTSTASMHGGFVLYNSGFNAGLTALTLIPILDFYKVKIRNADSPELFEIQKASKHKPLRFFRKK